MTDHDSSLEHKIDGIKGDMVDLTMKLDRALDKKADNAFHALADLPHSWIILIGVPILTFLLGYLARGGS